MTIIAPHPHAQLDRFPQLLESLAEEFGQDGVLAIAERVIEAEFADFHWDGRLAEMTLGACDGVDAEETEIFERVAIVGHVRGRYYVATCAVDSQRRIDRLLGLEHVDSYASAIALLLSLSR